MREIKFRAWDDADGVHRDEGCMSYGITDITCDAAHIMQYTGLKDKNGKEIYEGDILNSVGFYLSEVKYDDNYAQFVATDINFLDSEEQEWEVIGNIYENPELLGD